MIIYVKLLGVITATLICLLLSTSAVIAQASNITSPENGSTLLSSSITFTWEDVNSEYYLDVGTSAGANDIYGTSEGSNTSATVTGIPTDVPVYVKLWTRVSPTENSYYTRSFTYNQDIDNDGINDIIDPHLGAMDAKQVFSAPDHKLTLLGSGRVASLQISEALFDAMASGDDSYSRMTSLSKMIYQHLDDSFDFVFLVSDQNDVPSGAHYGVNYSVSNDTLGLGKSIFDNSASYGSAGELESVIHLTSKNGIRGGPSLHELMHRWGNSLDSVPTAVPGHWGYCSVGGQLGGWADGTLTNNDNGTYSANKGFGSNSFGGNANGGNSIPYSDFERYTMGLISITGLPDITIANGFNWVSSDTFTATSFTTVTMADVLATDGARAPDYNSSQKNFRSIVVVLSKEPFNNPPMSNGRWASYDQDVYEFALNADDGTGSYNFWEATGGLATIQMDGLLGEVIGSFGITHTEPSGSDIVVSFQSKTGKSYRFERSSNMMDPWISVETGIAGDGYIKSSSHTEGLNAGRMFYRFVEE